MAVRKSNEERERVAAEALDALLGKKKKPSSQPSPETIPPEETPEEIESSETATNVEDGSESQAGSEAQSQLTSLSEGSQSTSINSSSTSISESSTSESESAVSADSLVESHSMSEASESTSTVVDEPAVVSESEPTPVSQPSSQPEADPEAPTNIMALLAAQKKTKVGQYLRLDTEVKEALDQLTKQTDANGKQVRVPGTNGLISDIAQNGIVRELRRIGAVDDEFVRKFMISYDR